MAKRKASTGSAVKGLTGLDSADPSTSFLAVTNVTKYGVPITTVPYTGALLSASRRLTI